MSVEWVHAVYLADEGAVSLERLIEMSGLSESELRDLVECGALAPFDPRAEAWTFSAECIVTARTAHRLRDEFALDDVHSLAVLVRFVQRIEALEREIAALRAGR
jgi:chaperone modulatory protein CbpM